MHTKRSPPPPPKIARRHADSFGARTLRRIVRRRTGESTVRGGGQRGGPFGIGSRRTTTDLGSSTTAASTMSTDSRRWRDPSSSSMGASDPGNPCTAYATIVHRNDDAIVPTANKNERTSVRHPHCPIAGMRWLLRVWERQRGGGAMAPRPRSPNHGALIPSPPPSRDRLRALLFFLTHLGSQAQLPLPLRRSGGKK
jgi:hypothetical protein